MFSKFSPIHHHTGKYNEENHLSGNIFQHLLLLCLQFCHFSLCGLIDSSSSRYKVKLLISIFMHLIFVVCSIFVFIHLRVFLNLICDNLWPLGQSILYCIDLHILVDFPLLLLMMPRFIPL